MVSLGVFFMFRYLPGGHAIPLGVLNSFVHVVMYFYYFISALNPELKNSICLKKHMTRIQILQFLYLTVYFALPMMTKNCNYLPGAALFVLLQSVTMLVMFSDFYRRTYFQEFEKQQM